MALISVTHKLYDKLYSVLYTFSSVLESKESKTEISVYKFDIIAEGIVKENINFYLGRARLKKS